MLKPIHWDERRDLAVPGNKEKTLLYCAHHFIEAARRSVEKHENFFVALSGGSTPKALFEKLCSEEFNEKIRWPKVHLFWSDERAVPPNHPDSNYHMAMEAGFKDMPIPGNQIHRMVAEKDIDENALEYEKTIKRVLQGRPFDFMMLGMGEDGHTASLFPDTVALKVKDHLVVGNYVPQKQTYRMTMTYPCINFATHIVIYTIGSSKKEILAEVLKADDKYPIQKVGTKEYKALYIADEEAASLLESR